MQLVSIEIHCITTFKKLLFMHYTILFTADYISIMESLVFNGSATSDRQCVNITIVDDDLRESPIFSPRAEFFQVRLNASNDAVQLDVQTAFVSIEDDDCKYSGALTHKDVGLYTYSWITLSPWSYSCNKMFRGWLPRLLLWLLLSTSSSKLWLWWELL